MFDKTHNIPAMNGKARRRIRVVQCSERSPPSRVSRVIGQLPGQRSTQALCAYFSIQSEQFVDDRCSGRTAWLTTCGRKQQHRCARSPRGGPEGVDKDNTEKMIYPPLCAAVCGREPGQSGLPLGRRCLAARDNSTLAEQACSRLHVALNVLDSAAPAVRLRVGADQ